MSNFLITPTVLFITGTALVTVLVIVLYLSIYYYFKAKNIAPFLVRLEELQRKIAEAQTTLAETQNEYRDKLNEISKADKLIADGKFAEKWLHDNRSQVEVLSIEIDKQKAKLAQATENLKKRQDELHELTQQVADKNVAIQAMEKKKNALDINVSRLSEELGSLKVSITQKNKIVSELDSKIISLQSEKYELEATVKDLLNKLALLNKQLADQRSALDSATAELGATTKNLAKAQGAARVAETTLAQLDKTREMNEDRWKDLDRPFIQNPATPKASNFAESEWLNDFIDKLQKYGFIFDKRSIYAFHTGLKCAEISPLVVLAGISGTGKSLLPELYAASLGMNFLPVAVQPRWDSPQDMFGFYNYMEGRYKATELSRMLWQFDRYNNEHAKQIYEKQTPMNMVLLDEMNLARVEYYFSDLLSKLEIRNGLNPEDLDSRKKAEIEIESNASAENTQTRRLFVALNTLFVGTMNEDESTQTLSDKVIDRSNVIRFGQPKQLADTPNKDDFLVTCTQQENITLQNWMHWGNQSLDPNKRRFLSDFLRDTNAALAKVERPFGHRVSLAIEKYVACYPGDPDSALADQIEMKILPKLNGLDSQLNGFDEAMRSIENTIDQLGDDPLKTAFTESKENAADSFFKWKGVMR